MWGHSVGKVRVELTPDGFVFICECGWGTEPASSSADGVKDWQRHADGDELAAHRRSR